MKKEKKTFFAVYQFFIADISCQVLGNVLRKRIEKSFQKKRKLDRWHKELRSCLYLSVNEYLEEKKKKMDKRKTSCKKKKKLWSVETG